MKSATKRKDKRKGKKISNQRSRVKMAGPCRDPMISYACIMVVGKSQGDEVKPSPVMDARFDFFSGRR
jgi:hypothetical protein